MAYFVIDQEVHFVNKYRWVPWNCFRVRLLYARCDRQNRPLRGKIDRKFEPTLWSKKWLKYQLSSPWNGGQNSSRPHHPRLRSKSVPHQLEHLEEEPDHDGVLASEGLHQKCQHSGLSDDWQDSNGSDEHCHRLLREVHHQAKVDEEARVLTWKEFKVEIQKI